MTRESERGERPESERDQRRESERDQRHKNLKRGHKNPRKRAQEPEKKGHKNPRRVQDMYKIYEREGNTWERVSERRRERER